MSRLIVLTPGHWKRYKPLLLQFALKYGQQRLTVEGLRVWRTLEASRLDPLPGNTTATCAVILAIAGNRLQGVAAAVDGGQSACLLVVHPEARGQGVATALLQKLVTACGTLACQVALDNPACLLACFKAGLVACGLKRGATGKATLLLTTPAAATSVASARDERSRYSSGIACARHLNAVSER